MSPLPVLLLAAAAAGIPEAPPAPAPVVNRILATVGDAVVTERDLARIEFEQGRGFTMRIPLGGESVDLGEALPPAAAAQAPLERALERRVQVLLMVQSVRGEIGERLHRPLEDFREEILVETRRLLEARSRQALREEMEKAGMTLDRYLAFKEEEALVQILVEPLALASEPTPKDVSDYLSAHPDRFSHPARVALRQILLAPASPESRRFAEAIRERVAKGEEFAALARLHSQDSRAAEGGLFGPVAVSDLHPALAAAVRGLRAGEVAGPVESPAGIHLLKLESVVAPGPRPVGEVEPEIRKTLRIERIRERLREKLAEIEARIPVERTLPGEAGPESAPAVP